MENDLISRSALLDFAHNHVGGAVDCNDIARFPAVDAEPVRHGKWEFREDDVTWWWMCSECGSAEILPTNYCPNCGAKMDLEEINDQK